MTLSNEELLVMRSKVLHEGRIYMSSFPGQDNIASNAGLHNHISRLSRGQELTMGNLEKIHRRVEYRMKAMQTADAYVSALGLPGPGGCKCAQWDIQAWMATTEAKELNNQQFQGMLERVGRSGLFPQPPQRQGQAFPKLNLYIAAALAVAKIDPDMLLTMLDELVKCK